MNSLHIAAIFDARQKNLYSALVRNALSDHYLHDFFAPGHITTIRENAHDAIALAMHDRANKSGACFGINQDNWSTLNKKNNLQTLNKILTFIKNQGIAFLIDNEEDKKTDIKMLINNIEECGNSINKDEESKLEKWNNSNITSKQDLILTILEKNTTRLFLQGDGRLKDNPIQQLFMLLVEVQSIIEVLNAYDNNEKPTKEIGEMTAEICNVEKDKFIDFRYTTNYCWKGIFAEEKDKVIAPYAQIKSGKYQFSDSVNDNESNVTSVALFFERHKYAFPTVADAAFLLSFGAQAPADGNGANFEAQLEWIPLSIGTSKTFDWLRDITIQKPSTECYVFCNFGFSYGINYVDANDYKATGFQFRAIKVIPKISGQLSVNLRRNQYQRNGINEWQNTYGVRYDNGFSLHSFYIGFQRGYGYNSTTDYSLEKENIITFGWTIAFPISRPLNHFDLY